MSAHSYSIILTTDKLRLELDPALIPGVAVDLPVVLADVQASITLAHTNGTLKNAVLAGWKREEGFTVRPFVGLTVDEIGTLLDTCGIVPLETLRIIPTHDVVDTPHEVPAAMVVHGVTHVSVALLSDVQRRLRRVATDVLEAMEAIGDGLVVTKEDYIPCPPDVLDALLVLRESVLVVPEIQSALATVTNSLQPKDGFGHTLVNSTVEGLLQEHAGAEAGDNHEKAITALIPDIDTRGAQ